MEHVQVQVHAGGESPGILGHQHLANAGTHHIPIAVQILG